MLKKMDGQYYDTVTHCLIYGRAVIYDLTASIIETGQFLSGACLLGAIHTINSFLALCYQGIKLLCFTAYGMAYSPVFTIKMMLSFHTYFHSTAFCWDFYTFSMYKAQCT